MIPCILIADDEKETLNFHRIILKHYGFRIRSTTSLNKIKKIIATDDIDCVHLDIVFDLDASEPDWSKPNGISVISEILKGRLDIPVMVISAYLDAQVRQKAEEYGINDIIYKWYKKPVDYEVVALDTIKAINEFKFKNTKNAILDHVRKSNRDNDNSLEPTLSKLPIVKPEIKLRTQFLINKLEDLCYKILVNFELYDYKLFKELVLEHLHDYFCNISINHLALSTHLVTAISQVEEKNIMRTEAIETILNILEYFRKNNLSREEVYIAKDSMETTLGIRFELAPTFFLEE